MDGGLTEAIKTVVQWLFAPLLAIVALAWLCVRFEALGTFDAIRDSVRKMSAFQRFAAAAFLAVFIVFASEKTNSPPADLPPDVLRDTDGDTIPDAYEVHNGTNPYVPDYIDAHKLTVGPSGLYADISSAIAASKAYSIIELDAMKMHVVGYMGVRMPQHPVMICAPPGPPAIVRTTSLSAFLLDSGTTSQTLFRNLYVLLDATSGFQAGFWVGGNLPWYSMAASATFEDIYVRAPKPGVEHFGWLLSDRPAIRVPRNKRNRRRPRFDWQGLDRRYRHYGWPA